ncbi:hypothetical protein R1flu_000144 [Riccia fluitans]|uniref:AP2/ERF domain-containing protein n=1 Tax=Riccia fluitans TaxID=41844 RepID=A0ABD1Y3S6_9MARC
MAADRNVGSTTSGSSRRSSSSGGRAGSVASSSLSKTLSAGSNAEVNSSETSSRSFSCLTATTTNSSSGSDSEGAVAATPMETTTTATTTENTTMGSGGGGGGMRRATSASGKNKKRFVGVRQRPSGRWVAEIKDTTQKIRLWLGTFDTAEDAAHAYDEAAWLLRGANTRTNFVPTSSSTDASVLPSKAARLLQLRKNAATAKKSSKERSTGTTTPSPPHPPNPPMNSKPQSSSQTKVSEVSEINSGVPRSEALLLPSSDSNSNQTAHQITTTTVSSSSTPAAAAASSSPYCNSSSSIGHVSTFSGEPSKSESSSYESSMEEMCSFEEAAAATPSGFFQPDLGGGGGGGNSQRRNDYNPVSEELVTSSYQQSPPVLEVNPIRENRKEKDYCSEALPPQNGFVDDADMSSGLSGLDDVDLTCADFVYSSPFDFSMDMGPPGLDLGNLISSPLSAGDCCLGEEDSLSDHWRRMSYEKQVFAVNGMHEISSSSSMPSSLMMGGQSNAWNGGLSSPSLSIVSLPLDDIWVQEVDLRAISHEFSSTRDSSRQVSFMARNSAHL